MKTSRGSKRPKPSSRNGRKRIKALFFGTSEFAVPSLRAAAQRARVAGVVTQPDRPAGRGQRLTPSPVKRAAIELGIPVHHPPQLKAFAREIAGDAYDVFALASYGRILPAELLDVPRLGALNVHPSLLPSYRGATPIQAALRNGDARTGVTLMLMDAGMDTGDIVAAREVDIEPGETYGELHDRLARAGAELLAEALDAARAGPLPHEPQRGDPSTTRPIGKDDLAIDWHWPVARIVDAVRAYSPQPAARAQAFGETLKILRAHAENGVLVVDELIAPNRGRTTGAAYLHGRRWPVND